MAVFRFFIIWALFFPCLLPAAPRKLHNSDPIPPAKEAIPLSIFIHGYGTDHSYFKEEAINEHTLHYPWARITFGDAPKYRRFLWWTNFNMGQQKDAAQIISFLWEIHQKGYTSLIAMAHSRGGAAWISALHTIWFWEQHTKFWRKFSRQLQIPHKTIIERLQKLLRKTTSIIVHPLLSVHAAARHTLKRKYHLSNFSSACCAAAYRTSLSLCSSYSLRFPEAINLLHELIDHRYIQGKLLLCKNDKIVGNLFDKELQQKNYPPIFETCYSKAPNHFCLQAGYELIKQYLIPNPTKNLCYTSAAKNDDA